MLAISLDNNNIFVNQNMTPTVEQVVTVQAVSKCVFPIYELATKDFIRILKRFKYNHFTNNSVKLHTMRNRWFDVVSCYY